MKTKNILYLIFSSVLFSCHPKEEKKDEPIKQEAAPTESVVIPDESIYNLQSKWITQNGDSITLDHLKGKIMVAAMVFTHCEYACPRITSDIQRIEKEFSEIERKNINFVLISMDPERDTPTRFKEFAREHKLNPEWVMISSNDGNTMVIANVLNVRIKKLSGGGFDHSNIIHILNKQGVIVYQQNGLEQQPDETVKKIKGEIGK